MLLLTWTDFKAYFTGFGISIRGFETAYEYIVYANDNGFIVYTQLDKSPSNTTERDDYVNNYKTNAVPTMSGKWRPHPELYLLQAPVCAPVTTNLFTGLGTFSFKVPGTFSGYTDTTNARFFKSADFYADTIALGDYIDDIQITDSDGVIPVPARAAFPSYPTIIDFSTDTGCATGSKAGYYLDKDGHARITTIDDSIQLVPSGLYFKATVHGGLGKVYRVNLVWGRVKS